MPHRSIGSARDYHVPFASLAAYQPSGPTGGQSDGLYVYASPRLGLVFPSFASRCARAGQVAKNRDWLRLVRERRLRSGLRVMTERGSIGGA
jgi:hypothetical protein